MGPRWSQNHYSLKLCLKHDFTRVFWKFFCGVLKTSFGGKMCPHQTQYNLPIPDLQFEKKSIIIGVDTQFQVGENFKNISY